MKERCILVYSFREYQFVLGEKVWSLECRVFIFYGLGSRGRLGSGKFLDLFLVVYFIQVLYFVYILLGIKCLNVRIWEEQLVILSLDQELFIIQLVLEIMKFEEIFEESFKDSCVDFGVQRLQR